MTTAELSALLIATGAAVVSGLATWAAVAALRRSDKANRIAREACDHAEKANQISEEANRITKEAKAVTEQALAFEQDKAFFQEQTDIRKDHANAIARLRTLQVRFEERQRICGKNCRFQPMPAVELLTIEKGLSFLSERLRRLKLLTPKDLESMAQIKSELNGAKAVWDVMAAQVKSDEECSDCKTRPRTPLPAEHR